jgi:hypothetical protein
MLQPVPIDWRTYQHIKFIDRPEALRCILEWIRRSSEKQVYLVVGPPGCGKTWILNEVEYQLKNDPTQQRAGPLFVLKLDAPTLINRFPSKQESLLKKTETNAWVKNAYTQAKLAGLAVPSYDPEGDISTSVQDLVKALCTKNGLLDVVLLVDGFDELEGYEPEGTDTHRFEIILSDRILAPFIQRPCVHMVVTHRDPGGLHHDALRTTQERLNIPVMDPPISAYMQYLRFCTPPNCPADDPAGSELLNPDDFVVWQKTLKYYQWDLPFVNDHIFYSAIQLPGGKLEAIERWMLVKCIHDLFEKFDPATGMKHYPLLSDKDLELLRKLAALDENFTNESLQNHLGINVFSDEFRKFMTVYGIIAAVPRSQRYQMIGSLRNLLLEL